MSLHKPNIDKISEEKYDSDPEFKSVFKNIIQGLEEAIEYERKNKMNKISDINTIREFKNEDRVYGVYSVIFNGKQEIFIRNGKSIGVVQHYLGEPASKCVGEIRDNVKLEFLSKIEYNKGE